MKPIFCIFTERRTSSRRHRLWHRWSRWAVAGDGTRFRECLDCRWVDAR